MASLFDLLRDTMPIAAAEFAATWGESDFDDLALEDVLPFLRYLAPDESYEAIVPPIKETNYKDNNLGPLQRLWAWKHDASDPAVVKDVWCRVRDAGFISHKVFESIEWGHEDADTREYKKQVRVVLTSGTAVELPLNVEFIQAKWVVTDGVIEEDQTELWRLPSRLDKGLVVAFVYELDESNVPRPWKPKPSDPGYDDLKDALDAARETGIQSLARKPQPAPKEPDRSSEERPYVFASWTAFEEESAAKSWGSRIRRGQLMPRRAAQAVVAGEVPSKQAAEVGPTRILLVLSLSTCRERSDFEPAGFVGMARIYPHIMAIASAPLRSIEASIRYNRPAATTLRETVDGVPGAELACHGTYHVSNGAISSVLIADANDRSFRDLAMPIPAPLPFWSNLFGYYVSNGHAAVGNDSMKVVRTDRRERRERDDLVRRDIVLSVNPFDYSWLKKEARQGELDNIHMAPSMRIVGVTHVQIGGGRAVDIRDPAVQKRLCMDEVYMAPFCAHDCLHTHWRWGTELTVKTSLGWGATGPYTTAGSPMVPLNQDVRLWLRAANLSTYHVTTGRPDGSADDIPAAEWQVMMHHGSAYAVFVTGPLLSMMSKVGADSLSGAPDFYALGEEENPMHAALLGKWVRPMDSHAVFYWKLRYEMEFSDVPVGIDAPPLTAADLVLIERTKIDEPLLARWL